MGNKSSVAGAGVAGGRGYRSSHPADECEAWPEWYKIYRRYLGKVGKTRSHTGASGGACAYTDPDMAMWEYEADPTELLSMALQANTIDRSLGFNIPDVGPHYPPNDKLALMKTLHRLDQDMMTYEHRELDIYHLPKKFLEHECDTFRLEHLVPGNGIILNMEGVIIIKSGSRVEGAMMARLLKDKTIICETDELIVFDTFGEYDWVDLMAIPNKPGRYHVDHIVIHENMGMSIDANDLKKFLSLLPTMAPYDDHVKEMGFEEKLDTVEHGPAGTLDIHFTSKGGTSMYYSYDNVPAIVVDHWPTEAQGWLHRSRLWPPPDVVQYVSRQPLLLVHKPSTSELQHAKEWTLSFTLVEQIISQRRTDGMKLTYLIFKTIFYTCFNFTIDGKEFGSYLAKTTMNSACEKVHPAQWTEGNIKVNLQMLFKTLYQNLKDRRVPHYFIPGLNLVQHLPDALFTMMAERINWDKLISDPLSFLPDNIEKVCKWQESVLRHLTTCEKIAEEVSVKEGWKRSKQPRELVMASYPEFKAMLSFKISCMKTAELIDSFIKNTFDGPSQASSVSGFMSKSDIICQIDQASIFDVQMVAHMRSAMIHQRLA